MLFYRPANIYCSIPCCIRRCVNNCDINFSAVSLVNLAVGAQINDLLDTWTAKLTVIEEKFVSLCDNYKERIQQINQQPKVNTKVRKKGRKQHAYNTNDGLPDEHLSLFAAELIIEFHMKVLTNFL